MKRRISLSTTHMILLSFLLAILIGSVLLVLPISSANGKSIPYTDALFTATTSVCVTGLVTVTTASAWSFFGQLVILLLIQIGGLGIITILSGFMIGLHKKIGLGDRLLLQDAFNLNSMAGIVKFLKKVIVGTFVVEGAGALLYMTVFVPEYGAKGIWISIFNAVSAFCNAGMDVIGEESLCGYVQHPMINLVTSMLIILGGLGYIVWWDIIRVMKLFKKQKFQCFKKLTLHSKIALSATGVLLLSGSVLFFLFEYRNPQTIGELSLAGKLQAAIFQSVTTRTAGFATVPQQNLTDASAIVSLLLMFIGGSPVGTAGGVKTVTIAVLLLSAFSVIRNREDTVLFERTISKQAVGKAVAVVSMSFLIAFVSTVLLAAVSGAPALDVMYETFSATATVGLSRNLTASLDFWGKLIIIVTMYLGRVGPISLAIAFNTKKRKENIIKNPTEEISVG
ncbi:MAG: potassium transporter KtrB [Lachnospiraceae bacterium]|nr:potassium transporter KtrB [Lachnospiraceae bacterium]